MMYRLLPIVVLCVALQAEDSILEHARQVNMERASNMPNFVAHEVVTTYLDRRGSGEWRHGYTVEDEITVKGNLISRRDFFLNGRPLRRGSIGRFGITPGIPANGFAAALQPLFDPRCPTTLVFAGDDELGGKAVLVYRFDSPANGCFGNLYGGFPYNAARTGRVLIDGATGGVLQFEEQAFGFPKRFSFAGRHEVMTWDHVKIGELYYWLPVSAEFIWSHTTPARNRAVVEYRNHRHFESTTDVRYR